MSVRELAKAAAGSAAALAALGEAAKNQILLSIREALIERKEEIFSANREDLRDAEASGLAVPLLKRLKFDEGKLAEVCEGIRSLVSLNDPIGEVLSSTELAEGMILKKVRCPLGVIGVIFESRPDALVQIAGLCIKSGNAALLKGGSEAAKTNTALFSVLRGAAVKAGLPEAALSLLASREEVSEMLSCDGDIDLIIPRGSNAFVKYIMDHSDIPVMGHADGICHLYVDRRAEIGMAVALTVDAKTQYPAVCNAIETVLVHKEIAAAFLPAARKALAEKGVTVYGCAETAKYVDVLPADEKSYRTEYLDLKLNLKIVESLDEAVSHINRYGSGHTDAIVTADAEAAERFMNLVKSADAHWNCSTRFADGFRYGLGAEVGVGTGKLHARGPVGLEGLTTYKYKLYGSGQTVAPFVSGERSFTHKKL